MLRRPDPADEGPVRAGGAGAGSARPPSRRRGPDQLGRAEGRHGRRGAAEAPRPAPGRGARRGQRRRPGVPVGRRGHQAGQPRHGPGRQQVLQEPRPQREHPELDEEDDVPDQRPDAQRPPVQVAGQHQEGGRRRDRCQAQDDDGAVVGSAHHRGGVRRGQQAVGCGIAAPPDEAGRHGRVRLPPPPRCRHVGTQVHARRPRQAPRAGAGAEATAAERRAARAGLRGRRRRARGRRATGRGGRSRQVREGVRLQPAGADRSVGRPLLRAHRLRRRSAVRYDRPHPQGCRQPTQQLHPHDRRGERHRYLPHPVDEVESELRPARKGGRARQHHRQGGRAGGGSDHHGTRGGRGR
mmetsp:Transcript_13587/g.32259  ORF Transcript_13587/g.32259 Transcript_13587/m.32259 type:complete len:353 (+) Transcript_13587:586-1644(+)